MKGKARPKGRLPRWPLLVLSWVVVPVLLLLGAEAALRMAGAGQSTRFLETVRVDGRTAYWVNKNFYFQFLYDQEDEVGMVPYDRVMPEAKGDNTYRMVLLGGSAAQGWLAWDYNMGRILLAMLREAFPEREFELLTAAFYGMNSHVMRHVATQCGRFDPDLYLVYLGNNEMVGPFGLMSVLGRKDLTTRQMQRMVEWHIAASNLRLVQLLGEQAQRYTFRQVGGLQWGYSAPVSSMDDARLLRVYRCYQDNLEAICREAEAQGAGVALCTVGANVRDWRPFGARNRGSLAGEELDRWSALYDAGVALEEQEEYGEALERYLEASAIDDSHAGLRFRMGTCYLALGDDEEAARHLEAAGEWSYTFDFADQRITEAIHAAAKAHEDKGVFLVDAKGALASNSPHGLPGREFFFDHMHLRFEGNYQVAKAMYARVAPRLAEEDDLHGPPPPLSLEEAREALGLSEAVELRHLNQALDYLANLGDHQPMEHLHARRDYLETVVKHPVPSMRDGFARAVKVQGADFYVRWRYCVRLIEMRQYEEALDQASILKERFPHQWRSHWSRCDALLQSGDPAAALEAFADVRRWYPQLAETHYQWGNLLLAAEQPKAARTAFRRAASMKPGNATARFGEARALEAMEKWRDAVAMYGEVIDDDPHAEHAYQGLRRLLRGNASEAEAEAAWRGIMGRHENVALPHYFAAQSLAEAGHFQDALNALTKAAEMNVGFQERAARELITLCKHPLREGDFGVALAMLREAHGLAPHLAEGDQMRRYAIERLAEAIRAEETRRRERQLLLLEVLAEAGPEAAAAQREAWRRQGIAPPDRAP